MDIEDLHLAVGRLEGKTDQVLSLLNKLNGRVSKVETWQSRAIGWTAGVMGCVGLVYAIISLVK